MKRSIEKYLGACAPGLAVLLLHSTLGTTFGHEPIVDPVSHFLGGSAVAYCVLTLIDVFEARSVLAETMLALGIAALAACGWEFGELASDVFFGTTIQQDAAETLRDEAMGIGGALIAVLIRRVWRLYHSSRAGRMQ